MIKVSIIIPVFNVSNYIEGCICSVMKQTYPNIECVIVDDASLDDSIDKCEKLIAAYQGPIKFIVLRHEQNRGQAAARNTGTETAVGEYIYYLDSDDEISSDCIEKLVKPLMEDNSIEVVQGNLVWIKKTNEIPNPAFDIPAYGRDINTRESVRKCYFEDMIPYSVNKLISKSYLNQNQLRFKEGIFWEDVLWLHFFAKKLNHLYLVPDVTYLYYRRPHSTTTGMARAEKIKNYAIVYEEIANNLTSGEEDNEVLLYLHSFCQCYLVARGDARFLHAYSVFYRVLSNGGHTKALRRLKTVRFISEHAISRYAFEIAFKLYHSYQRIVYLKK